MKLIGTYLGVPMYSCEEFPDGFAMFSTLDKGTPYEKYQVIAYVPKVHGKELIKTTLYPSSLGWKKVKEGLVK